MRTLIKIHLIVDAAHTAVGRRMRMAWVNQRGDVTSTVIIIAVLVAAAVAAGVVITTFISDQTDKLS